MHLSLAHEIKRLEKLRAALGLAFTPEPGASLEEIHNVEAELGFTFDPNLRDFYLFSNGSALKDWFVASLSQPTTCCFLKLAVGQRISEAELALEAAGQLLDGPDEDRDPRIQPNFWCHRCWFPWAENGCGSLVYFDAIPAVQGTVGQIIIYQHDPDTIYYGAPDFLTFFRQSNDLLEQYFNGELGQEELYFDSPF